MCCPQNRKFRIGLSDGYLNNRFLVGDHLNTYALQLPHSRTHFESTLVHWNLYAFFSLRAKFELNSSQLSTSPYHTGPFFHFQVPVPTTYGFADRNTKSNCRHRRERETLPLYHQHQNGMNLGMSMVLALCWVRRIHWSFSSPWMALSYVSSPRPVARTQGGRRDHPHTMGKLWLPH
jgi:hypothetical protein